jgi:predicted enzyme related to lactoylglutathione lyase
MAKKRSPRTVKRAPVKRASKKKPRSSPPRHVFTRDLYGWITHTDLASFDPAATRAWCTTVLGWTFRPSFPTPAGEYHLFAYAEKGGGGIRGIKPPEVPGSMPYIHVADAQAAFDKAIREGAEPISPPERVMEGVTIAVVRAPGGVPIGLSGP